MLIITITGCISKPIGHFSERDFSIIEPFNKVDTIIYLSPDGYSDTIIFYKAQVDTAQIRSFELGYYDAYLMGVEYELSRGSYHSYKFITNKDTLYSTVPEPFYSVEISTENFCNKSLSFLGLIYKEDELNKMFVDTTMIMFFNGMGKNSSRGVNSFKFSPQIGIISYTDTTGAVWKRTSCVKY